MSNIITEVRAELADAHAAQQAARFGRLLLVTTGAQLAALGTAHLGRDALIGAAVGAVETAYRQWAPVVPWAALATKLHLIASAPAPAPAPAPAASPAAPAAPPVPASGSGTPAAPPAAGE